MIKVRAFTFGEYMENVTYIGEFDLPMDVAVELAFKAFRSMYGEGPEEITSPEEFNRQYNDENITIGTSNKVFFELIDDQSEYFKEMQDQEKPAEVRTEVDQYGFQQLEGEGDDFGGGYVSWPIKYSDKRADAINAYVNAYERFISKTGAAGIGVLKI